MRSAIAPTIRCACSFLSGAVHLHLRLSHDISRHACSLVYLTSPSLSADHMVMSLAGMLIVLCSQTLSAASDQNGGAGVGVYIPVRGTLGIPRLAPTTRPPGHTSY